jgi:TonB-linked SusC/RagA family outer membrane protein
MKKRNIQFMILFMFGLFNLSMLGQQDVTGVVTGETSELLPGVSVLEKGTNNGVTTDFDGNFKISVANSQSILVISFVGMKTQEVVVSNQSNINVELVESSEALDEVVITALGISREKKSLGYSVSEVDGDDLTNVPQENVLNGLSGKVSGVAINSTGGPGSSVSMVIRGATSLTSDNQPLFVIDGIPVANSLNNVSEVGRDNRVDFGNAISDINADDIESMTVLKGASAAALYGARAGNGVVLITTKSGKASKGLGVSVSTSMVFEDPYKFLDTHTKFAAGSRPYTEGNFPNNPYGELLINEGSSGWAGPELNQGVNAIHWPYSAEEIASGNPVARELRSHNNAENFFETATTQTNNISIQDNTEKIDYRLSLSNMKHQGFIPNSDLNRKSISFNSSVKLTDNFTVSSVLNFTKSGSNSRPASNRGANPIQAMYEISPHINILDMKDYWLPGYEGLVQNSPYSFGDDPTDTEWNNPYFLANEALNSFDRNRVYGNLKAEWQITDDFSVMGRYNYDETNEVREMRVANGYTRESNGIYGIFNIHRSELNADFLLNYKKKYDNWDFSVSAGGNMMKQNGQNIKNATKYRGAGLIIPGLYHLSNIAPENLDYTQFIYEKQIKSLYALASFGYKNMAYLDLTYRKDWSSTLPEGTNDYDYPSVSTSFLLNNMFDMGEKVSLVKLRGGYAEVGNDTSPYNLYPTLGNAGAWGDATQLVQGGTLLNPNLKPESQTSYEIGTDLAFFQNRLRADFTYYTSDNKNQIFAVDAAPTSGFSKKLINAGLITSVGYEAGISGTIITNKDWNWDLGMVYSKNRTTIEELADGMDYLRLWGDAKGGAYTWLGEEIGNIIDRALVRVDDPSSEYHGWPLLDDEGWENDDRTLQDADGNRVAPIIGNFNPDFIIGATTTVTYKNWKLGMNFDWRKGGQFVSQTHRYGESDMHTQRWLDKLNNLSDISDADLPQFLKDNADEYLLEGGQFFPLVGGPTAEAGGYPFSDGGITLNDGVFLPGVSGSYDPQGNFVADFENLGDPSVTQYHNYADHYPWSFTRAATFDADFVKLREVSLTYLIPNEYLKNIGLQTASFSVYSRNIILWTKADIGIDPEQAFQAEGGTQTSGIQFKQGIERFNVNPWAIPVGFKLNITF